MLLTIKHPDRDIRPTFPQVFEPPISSPNLECKKLDSVLPPFPNSLAVVFNDFALSLFRAFLSPSKISETGCGRRVPFPRYHRRKLEGGPIRVGTATLQRSAATFQRLVCYRGSGSREENRERCAKCWRTQCRAAPILGKIYCPEKNIANYPCESQRPLYPPHFPRLALNWCRTTCSAQKNKPNARINSANKILLEVWPVPRTIIAAEI